MIAYRFYLDDTGLHVEVCSRRCRKGLIRAMRGGMWRFAPDAVVKVLSGRCGLACGGLLLANSYFVLFDDSGWHGGFAPGDFAKVLF